MFLNLFKEGNEKTKRIYFDHASATLVNELVLERQEINNEFLGNPSSIHKEGEIAKEYLLEAKKKVARCIKAKVHNVHFVSTVTEANNIFIKGVMLAENLASPNSPHQIIYSSSDHASIVESVIWCQRNLSHPGNQILLIDLKPNQIGKFSVEDFLENLNENTKLICLSYVNSEVGTIQEIKKITQAVKVWWNKNFPDFQSPKIFIDATQAVKYFELDVHNLGVDGLSFNFSKLGGLAGGVLWVKDQIKLESVISGGGQEGGVRSGTENLPTILANSFILEKICNRDEQKSRREYVYNLRNYCIRRLEGLGEKVKIWGDSKYKYNKFFENSAPHILLLSVPNILGEELTLRLDAKGISVSPATACSLLNNSGSHFLRAIGEPVLAKETIRVSFGETNTTQEIDFFVEALSDIIHKFGKD